MTAPDLSAAATVIDLASDVVQAATRKLAEGSIDDQQVMAYDLAHAASAVETARGLLDYGNKGDIEGRITCAFVADAVHDLAAKTFGREADWGIEPGALDGARAVSRRPIGRRTSSRRSTTPDLAISPTTSSSSRTRSAASPTRS